MPKSQEKGIRPGCCEEEASQAKTGRAVSLPGHFEDPQEAHTPEHRDPQGRHELQFHQNGFSDPSTHHKAIKAVEEGDKVSLEAQAVHLHQHLTGKQSQEDFVGNIWKDKGQVYFESCSGFPFPLPPLPSSVTTADTDGLIMSLCCTGNRDHPYCCWTHPRYESIEVIWFFWDSISLTIKW